MARLYLDEHMQNFAQQLSDEGHDVLFCVDEGGEGRTDAWHFRQAVDAGRVLLSFNRSDFQFLHRLWTTLRTWNVVQTAHAGILTATRVLAPSEWLPVLHTRLEASEPLTESPDTTVWHQDGWKADSED